MSQLKLTADGGGGTVALKGPASTTGNAAIELTAPGTANGTILTTNSSVGKILQVVAANKTDTFSASASNGTYHDITGLSVSITMTNASNKVLIQFQSSYSTGSDLGQRGSFRLLRGSTVINVGDTAGSRTRGIFPSMEVRQTQMSTPVAGCFLDTPGTGTHTYKLQVGAEAGAGTVVVNSTTGGDSVTHYRGASNLIVMEVAA